MKLHTVATALLIAFLLGTAAGFTSAGSDEITFADAEQQSRQFMGWHQTVKLTPEQEAVKRAALGNIPAPCCSDNSAYTCCCPCNMSRTIWGLSQYLIAKQGADADTVRAKVREWIRFIGPNGFSGDVCYTGGCGRPFAKNGCGGMNAARLVF